MFNVVVKNNNNVKRTVYAVRQTKDGKIEFLIYENAAARWLWMDAQLYKPEGGNSND